MLSIALNSITDNKDKLAKPSRKHVYAFGKGELDISGSTMDFLMYISPYVDLDGRIVLPMEQCRFDLLMQTNTYKRVMHEAIHNELIYFKDGYYYSNFHVHTDGSKSKFEYVKLINAYSSKEVLNYSLRNKRLFYYFASVIRMGNWFNINVENLYKNQLHSNDAGIKYFDNYKQVAAALITLIKNGHIEIKVFNSPGKGTILNNKSLFLEQEFHSYFGFTDKKKSRTSKIKKEKHLLQIRIHPNLKKDELSLSASETEFIHLAKTNNIAFDELNTDNVKYIVGFKNELYKRFGDTGLAIYRRSIQAFLKEKYFNVEYYDRIGTLTNNFMNFYILKEIREIVSASAYLQKHRHHSLNDKSSMFCKGYKVSFESVGQLLAYYMEKGTINHNVLLDGFMMKNNINYTVLSFNQQQWMNLHNSVTREYESCKPVLVGENVNKFNDAEWRAFMISNAEQGMLTEKEEFDKLLKNLHSQLYKTSSPKIVKKVPFYNWLDERD